MSAQFQPIMRKDHCIAAYVFASQSVGRLKTANKKKATMSIAVQWQPIRRYVVQNQPNRRRLKWLTTQCQPIRRQIKASQPEGSYNVKLDRVFALRFGQLGQLRV